MDGWLLNPGALAGESWTDVQTGVPRDSAWQQTLHENTPILEAIDLPLSEDDVKAAYEKHLNATLLRLHRLSAGAQVERRGEGVWIEDAKGEKHLDCISACGIFSLGHCHPEVIDAVGRQ